MSNDDIKKWLDELADVFLIDIGIRQNQTILDLGCGMGNYAIPAAGIVGKNGKVYAVDKDRKTLDGLKQRKEERQLENIEIVDVSEGTDLPLQDESVDVVLLYDVIHQVNNRKELLAEMCRVSKPNALLSVYPRHHQEDMNMNLDDVKNEIESAHFRFKGKIYKKLIHNNCLEQGYVLNFRKN